MIADRLQKIRKHLKLSQTEMSQQTGISYRAYTSYEHGDRKPSLEFLQNLVCKMNVNLNWIIAGTGDMFISTECGQDGNNLTLEVKKILQNEGIINPAL